MSITDELAGVAPIGHAEMKIVHQPPSTESVPAAPLPQPTADELRAVDTAFTQDKEGEALAAMLAFHTGALLLVDLAHEHFSEPEELTTETPRQREED